VTSGLRLGSPAVTTRGFGEGEMRQVASWIDRVLGSAGEEGVTHEVREEVRGLCTKFPMPGHPVVHC
jgi:glycine hydroxymethyltransferase